MTTSQNAHATSSPRLRALTLARNQVSKQLSRRLPYYLTPERSTGSSKQQTPREIVS